MKILLFLLTAAGLTAAVFPEPREMRAGGEDFLLDAGTAIAVPQSASPLDWKLARLLSAELADAGVAVRIEQFAAIPKDRRVIVMGAASNPLVASACASARKPVSAAEGYTLESAKSRVCVVGADDRGAFYGYQTLRQLISKNRIAGASIRDWPLKPFRGIKLYLPGRDHIPFFNRFVADFYRISALQVHCKSA